MKKFQENIVVKIVLGLITAVIMGVLVILVNDYYREQARKEMNNSVEEEPAQDEKEEKKKDIEFSKFKNRKTNIFIDDQKNYLDIENTDAGILLTFNEIAIIEVTQYENIEYAVLDDALLVKVIYKDHQDFYIIDQDSSILSSLTSTSLDNEIYRISDPVIKDKYQNSIEVKDNSIYITYVIDDLEKEMDSDTTIQYTTKITYDNGTVIDEDEIVSKYTFKDYKEK